MPTMVQPVVVPRAEHPISRRDIDPDALKVLYRLKEHDYLAYLVGGSVRDLLLGRHPKDFDIGTSAHPYEVKRLFRNCWIIGRRFRLAHVKFGTKTIEVATFRKQIVPTGHASDPDTVLDPPDMPPPVADVNDIHAHDRLIHRDNTFGTPEEDAFRRDFTVNALFYDIATFSIIDYVDGLRDIRDRVIRCIGDPDERFREDPVRMLRAIALAARLDFTIDPPILDAIRRHRTEIARAAPPRMLEEYYKILRGGASARAFRALAEVGLLEAVTPDLDRGAGDRLWQSLAALDRYRSGFPTAPDALTNVILLGSLLVPAGLAAPRPLPFYEDDRRSTPPPLGAFPVARRDLERLQQILALQRRLLDPNASLRARRGLLHRSIFGDALTWLEIHGDAADTVAQWRELRNELRATSDEDRSHVVPRRRRRRRRGRNRFPSRIQ
jgi:poly(A) polymerase